MRKLFLTALFGVAMGIGSAQADEVIIRTRPPHAIVETRGVRPSRDHVWIAGYNRWDGNAYVWTPGRWEAPPRPHAVWVAPRYVHRNGGYVFVEGRWR
jgi:hypothetical protein